MAQYNTLPVYKASYDLMIVVFEFCRHLTKEYKYTLGEKLKNETLELLMNIYRANSKHDKTQCLQNARENIEVTRLLFRLINDLKLIPIKKFIHANEHIENISKQLTGWQRSVK
jgi:four helix bundle protein